MSTLNRILVIFIFTTLGGSFSTLVTFFCVETHFHSLKYLGVALSLRTLSSCFFGYQTNRIIRRIGIKNSFILSQATGIISVLVLFLGFYSEQFITIILGLCLIALPATLNTISLTIAFKLTLQEDDHYRKYSGSRELIFGISRLIACLLTPLLLYKFNLYVVLAISAGFYLIGCAFSFHSILDLIVNETTSRATTKINHVIMKSKDTWIFICQTTSSLMLAAFIPILASSESLDFTKFIPQILRQSLWSIEASMMIFSSTIYLLSKQLRKSQRLKSILMINAVALVPLIYTTQLIAIIIVAIIISISIMLSFYIFRDDYVVKARSDSNLVETYSAISSIQKDLIYSISPALLTYFFSAFGLNKTIFLLVFFQLFFYVMCKILKKYPNYNYQIQES